MGNLSIDEFEKKLSMLPEAEADAIDMEMLADIDADTDRKTVPLEAVRTARECSGKISVRVPKELHLHLIESAKDNGVSLNQYIVYKLAK
jgi:LDH2 family malate/lactate/ureidoglycolate dehydrogenase